jgi:hypothetical protein
LVGRTVFGQKLNQSQSSVQMFVPSIESWTTTKTQKLSLPKFKAKLLVGANKSLFFASLTKQTLSKSWSWLWTVIDFDAFLLETWYKDVKSVFLS